MDALAFDLKRLCERSREGSQATQANRRRMLAQMAEDLKRFKLPEARSIKPKHIEFLVAKWLDEGIAHSTIKNRMSALRWWCQGVNKLSIMHRDNAEYGIAPREPARPRAWEVAPKQMKLIACPLMRATLVLGAEFGLRREEGIKFQVAYADKGDHIVLKPSWTKGGRGRIIPITRPYQRAVLNRLHALVGSGSLIPKDKTYYQHMKAFENACYAAKILNVHGLRHGYAQRRYLELTGWSAPAAGGPDRDSLSPRELRADRAARQQISNELGHGRISVVTVYLGT